MPEWGISLQPLSNEEHERVYFYCFGSCRVTAADVAQGDQARTGAFRVCRDTVYDKNAKGRWDYVARNA